MPYKLVEIRREENHLRDTKKTQGALSRWQPLHKKNLNKRKQVGGGRNPTMNVFHSIEQWFHCTINSSLMDLQFDFVLKHL